MTRVLVLLVTLFASVTLTLAEDQSRPNKSEESNSFNAELPVLNKTSRVTGQLPRDRTTRLPA